MRTYSFKKIGFFVSFFLSSNGGAFSAPHPHYIIPYGDLENIIFSFFEHPEKYTRALMGSVLSNNTNCLKASINAIRLTSVFSAIYFIDNKSIKCSHRLFFNFIRIPILSFISAILSTVLCEVDSQPRDTHWVQGYDRSQYGINGIKTWMFCIGGTMLASKILTVTYSKIIGDFSIQYSNKSKRNDRISLPILGSSGEDDHENGSYDLSGEAATKKCSKQDFYTFVLLTMLWIAMRFHYSYYMNQGVEYGGLRPIAQREQREQRVQIGVE